jgi:predicted ribosome quality control (RQC) complex YloA/Tae2 family protein
MLNPIPFDWFSMWAIIDELEPMLPARIQQVRQPSASTLTLELYSGEASTLLVSADPRFCRMHFIPRPLKSVEPVSGFLQTLRRHLLGATCVGLVRRQGDRWLRLNLESAEGAFALVIELMGKHSNIILVGTGGRVIESIRHVSIDQSKRPVHPGSVYGLPSVLGRGASPFLARLSLPAGRVKPKPVLVPGYGAYPVSVASLGYEEVPQPSLSVALDKFYSLAERNAEIDARRARLLQIADRQLAAKEHALSEVKEAERMGAEASEWQMVGELILAYGPTVPAGEAFLDVFDYEGNPRRLEVDPELGFVENAEQWFNRAKRARRRASHVNDQRTRLAAAFRDLTDFRARVVLAKTREDLDALHEEAVRRRWLSIPGVATARPEERPFEGHRIREMLGPGGITVLVGENSTSNDYLTMRVAKPNDYWLHVRGSTSAHVVIRTQNRPDRIQREHLEFAARLAVQNSGQKHAKYVPVDYTLKKYVRKPRGAPAGTVSYTHEKTLHIDVA